MNVSESKYDLTVLKISEIDCYMLPIPKADINVIINVECNFLYYIIDSNQKELSGEMEFISPRSPGCRY